MRSMRSRLAAMGLALACALVQGCGGDGGGEDVATDENGVPVTAAEKGTVEGRAFDAADGRPLAGVTLKVGDATAVTDLDGRYRIEAAAGRESALRAERAGYGAGLATATPRAGDTVQADVWLTPEGVVQAVSASAGGVVAVPGSAAAVTLPPAALVDAQGAAFAGEARVRLTPIDPARRPEAMPGRYATVVGGAEQAIESFGALRVEIEAAGSGEHLQLAAGQTATVRIPVAGRGLNPPATMPLFHLDETTGRWVEDGSATLVGRGPGAYYEGTVRHFSVWNVDIVIDTVWVSGCVRDAAGAAPSSGFVRSQGLDYAGQAWSALESGRFRVGVRRGGVAHVSALRGGMFSPPMAVGPMASDTDLGNACLVLEPSLAPRIVEPPMTHGAFEGRSTRFHVLAAGPDLRYQWLRDGTPIAGETGSVLVIPSVSAADAEAQFSVVVTNEHGSESSGNAGLVVAPPPPPFTADAAQVMQLAFFSTWALQTPLGSLGMIIGEGEGYPLLAPQQVCRSGSIDPALLNDRPIVAGDVVPQGSSRIELMFRDCVIGDSRPLNGRMLVMQSQESTDQRSRWQGRVTWSQQSASIWRVEGSGTFLRDETRESMDEHFLLAAGTVVGSGWLDNSATFLSGTFSRRTTFDAERGRTTQIDRLDDVRFDIAGDEFSVMGQREWSRSGGCGGAGYTVTRQGQRVGRFFCQGALWLVEINGVVSPAVPIAPLDKVQAPVMRR